MSDGSERRRFQRVRLDTPIAGDIGGTRVFVMDVGVEGALVAHQQKLPDDLRLTFDWDGSRISFNARVVHSRIARYSREAGKTLYHSGLEFVGANLSAAMKLKELVQEYVLRALDEQRANAKGIPPATTTFRKTAARQAGFLCLRFVAGAWRRAETSNPEQPIDGITISATEEPEQIELLCQSYQQASDAERRFIRELAALSVSSEDGVATRRFNP